MRKRSKKVSLENLGTHQLSEGVDIEGKGMIKYSNIEKSLPIEDQISPENVVELTNTKGETFDIPKIKKELSSNPLMSWIMEVPFPTSDVTNQHPDVIKIVEAKDNEIKDLKEVIAKKELDQLKKDKSNNKGSKATTIFIKNFCKPNFRDWFKPYHKKNYKHGELIDDPQVWEDYQASRAWENLQHDLELEQSYYKEGFLPHNSEMPSERTWVDVRVAIYAKMGLKRRPGRPPKK